MRFVDIEKAFDRVPQKVVEWAMKKFKSWHHGRKPKCSGFEPGFYVNSAFDLSCLVSPYLLSAFG